jgi:hypothetical protein
VATIENQVYGFSLTATPAVANVDTGGSANYVISVENTGGFEAPITIQLAEGYSSLVASPTSSTVNPPNSVTVTLDDNGTSDEARWYTVTVTATGEGEEGTIQKTMELRLLVNGEELFLPLVHR